MSTIFLYLEVFLAIIIPYISTIYPHRSQNFKKVVGIDPENKSIERAQKNYKKGNLHFQVGQGESLDFSSLSFDFVLFCQSLHHIPPKYQSIALEETWRVLSRHGRLVIIEPIYQKGAFEKIACLYNDEKEIRNSAQRVVKSLINNGFSLLLEKEIRIEDTCKDFDDLYLNNIKTKSYADWQESYKEKIESILYSCDITQNGDIILDYYTTIWLLEKNQRTHIKHINRTLTMRRLCQRSVPSIIPAGVADI